MAFVKLDCGILDSTLWIDRLSREIFITALLMAEPYELREPMAQLEVRELKETGFVVPPGWYGFVRAAGTGIIHRAGLKDEEGFCALECLGSNDPESRSAEYGGRRLVRVNGGYVVLNFVKYRERDHTAAERSKRYREKKLTDRHGVTSDRHGVTSRSVTQAEAEAEAYKKKAKPSSRHLAEKEFMEALEANPAYKHINFESEFAKMDAWLLAKPGRKKTRRFVVNWLNGVEQPLTALPRRKIYAT